MVAALQQPGIRHCTDLIGQDPYALHQRLSDMTPTWRDPCVIDTFISARVLRKVRRHSRGGPILQNGNKPC